MNTNQAIPISDENAGKYVRALLIDDAFEYLHGKLGGTRLYDSFIAVAAERQKGPNPINEQIYSPRIAIARSLLGYEANRKPLEHPTDAEAVARRTEDGTLEVLVGGGAAEGGHTIHMPPTGENSVTYGNGH